ncbi:MAG: mercuric reductase [Mariniblastus sp.]|nr:mercuric reductase [Mariniblastus sp.]
MSDWIQLQPFDEHNAHLRDNVHPRDWTNPEPARPYQLVVIGAGTAGLVTAAGAAGLGARVALVERDLMGGDCLNVGCVPSKSLIQTGRVLAELREAANFGVRLDSPAELDFAAAMQRMRRLRARISHVDSAQRFADLGVDVYFGQARFAGPTSLEIQPDRGSAQNVRFKKAVIATGARAAVPPIAGLDQVDYLTNESVFSLTELPGRLAIIGAGPIGVELAQVFARFGSRVTLLERSSRILNREDPDAAALIEQQLVDEGVQIEVGSDPMQLAAAGEGRIQITGKSQAGPFDIRVDKLLVATGRQPNLEDLQLAKAGVDFDRSGVRVNDLLRTSNRRIYAAGDVASRFQFTHAADFMARIVIQNALFKIGPWGAKKVSHLLIPRATYTAPELAQVGLTEQEARQTGVPITTLIQPLSENDRAILEGTENGFIKVHLKRGSDQIVGATVVARNGGDLISELTLAMQNRVGLAQIANTIHPYPTQADAIRRLGDQYNRTRLTPLATRLLKTLMRFNVGQP